MRSLFIVSILIVAVAIGAFKEGKKSQKHKNFEADAYAAEWGCLQGAVYGCELLKNEGDKYSCMDYAREEYCPKRAKAFKDFLSQSL